MKLHPVTVASPRYRPWCGPAALSIITGLPADSMKPRINAMRDRAPGAAVKGVRHIEMEWALAQLGFKVQLSWSYLRATGWDASVAEARAARPTLARWLAERQPKHMHNMLLVTVGNHYVVVKGRKLCDNFTVEPVFIRRAPHRRKRISFVYIIRRDS